MQRGGSPAGRAGAASFALLGRFALGGLATLFGSGCYSDRLALWGPETGFADGRAGGSVSVEWVAFPAGGSTSDVVTSLNVALDRSLLIVAPDPRIRFVSLSGMVDPRTGSPTIAGAVATPTNFEDPYESCTIFYDPLPGNGFSAQIALHETMHCLGFNDITDFENGPFQRCDADPDDDGDGVGDFNYMPDESMMSYCNNPGHLTAADIAGLRAAGY